MMVAARDRKDFTVHHDYSDVPKGQWFYPYVQMAHRMDLFDDLGGDSFDINEPMTRGKVAEAMYRYLDYKGEL